jgi:hypothetical protein
LGVPLTWWMADPGQVWSLALFQQSAHQARRILAKLPFLVAAQVSTCGL